jgi:heme/copper-type cytochrome/quinol oxidase subunit 2
MSLTAPSITFWLAVLACFVAQIAIIRAAISAPMTVRNDSASMPMPRRASEVAWTIVPAIGLAVLLVFTWRAVHRPAMSHEMPPGHMMMDHG